MTDQPENLPAVRSEAHSPVAIWDSADFAQTQRVALVLTRSGLVPQTLWESGDKDDQGRPVMLPEIVVAARCTLIANQARLWNADPLNVLQCTSLINGRLMYEGKLIAAVVASMTGVKLRYRFGKWNKDHIEFPPEADGVVDETFLHGAGEALAVRVYDPDDVARYVDGSVGIWRSTRAGNPWTNANNWPRQLRYRGAREWARAYEPGVILGILADGDQDVEEIVQTAKPVGLVQRLKGSQEGAGFNADQVQEQTGGKKPRRKKGDEPEEQAHARQPDPQTDAPADVTPPEAQSGSEPTEIFPEASSEASESPDGTATPASRSEHAAPGEVYLLDSDGYNNDQRRVTYKDGSRFSSVHKSTEGKYQVYAQHAPLIPDLDDDGIPEHMRDENAPRSIEEAQEQVNQTMTGVAEALADRPTSPEEPTETESAPPAEREPDTSEPATPASDAGAPPEEDSGQPTAMGADEQIKVFAQTVETVPTWFDVKKAMREFYSTDTFKGFPPDKQNLIRAATWYACVDPERKPELRDLPDQAADCTAFRLWIETQEDADAINGTAFTLQRCEDWRNAPEPMKLAISNAIKARLTVLKR